MATIRAIYLCTSDNKILLSRNFQTVENKQKKELGKEYTAIPPEKILSYLFYTQTVKDELLQEKFKQIKYEEDIDIDSLKLEKFINIIDFNLSISNYSYYSECPITTLRLDKLKHLKNFKKLISKSESKIENEDKSKEKELQNFEEDSLFGTIWPVVYVKYAKLYCFAITKIDDKAFYSIKRSILDSSEYKEGKISKNDVLFRTKKKYEDQDVSIVGAYTFVENILNHIIYTKTFEENKLHALISNMVSFGNINETNINFMIDGLQHLNKRHTNNSMIFSSKKSINENNIQEKVKIPGWIQNIHSNSNEKLKLIINENLKFIQYPKKKQVALILSDIMCQAQLSENCEVSLCIKEKNTKNTKNIRIHHCCKFLNHTGVNENVKISFNPPQEEFKLAVFEYDNFNCESIPITGKFEVKEFCDNKINFYMEFNIESIAIGKFEYFYITIPLGHFGIITDTDMMAPVGVVSVTQNKMALLWNLENNVIDYKIKLSGAVYFKKKPNELNIVDNGANSNLDKKYEEEIIQEIENFSNGFVFKNLKNINDLVSEKHFNVEEMLKNSNNINLTSDIMSSNCYCSVNFKLIDYSFSNIDIDKQSISFHPKISPNIQIVKEFVVNDYIIWNGYSFLNYENNINYNENNTYLHEIKIEEKELIIK